MASVVMTAALAIASPQTASPPAPAAAVYTNEEDVYFAREAGKPAPPWLAVRIERGRPVAIDAFGATIPEAPSPALTPVTEGLRATLKDGRTTLLRPARPVTCWAAVRRTTLKTDGSEDWQFRARIALHDQGGRARVGGDGAPAAVIRMRNVVWPSGPNRPSLVLYIHTPDDPDRAVSYAWADPGAARVGLNLRWIQASCTIDGREGPVPSPKEGQE